jgi:adenosylcobyric acid synthase
MLHGLFENDALRTRTLAALRARRGLPDLPAPAGAARIPTRQAEYDRLEAAVRGSLDLDLLRRLAQVRPGGAR